MRLKHQFTAIIVREKDEYVALCLELDLSGNGKTMEEAKKSLASAITTCLEKDTCRYIGLN
ncbi:MAG: hypothetical protein AAGU11_16820 [Syntrophobacteraceae bacterium]